MISQLRRLSHLSRLIIIDGLRRHALIGLILFALAFEAGGLVFFDFIPHDIGRASNDFLFSISWLTGFIFLFFHAVQVIAWDDQQKIIHTFLARPISRTEYVLGVFAGLSFLLLSLNLVLGSIGWIVLTIIKKSLDPAYFKYLSIYSYILTVIGLYCIELMILAVILFFSGVIRGKFPVLLLTVTYYFTCSGLPVVRQALRQQTAEHSSLSIDTLLKWMTAIFPDFSRLDFKTFVVSGVTLPPIVNLVSIFGISIGYILITLWFSCLLYQHRDFQ